MSSSPTPSALDFILDDAAETAIDTAGLADIVEQLIESGRSSVTEAARLYLDAAHKLQDALRAQAGAEGALEELRAMMLRQDGALRRLRAALPRRDRPSTAPARAHREAVAA